MTEHTLHNWTQRDASSEPERARPGRPATPAPVVRSALRKVRREMRRQGRTAGWRPIAAALEGAVSVALVQRCLALWKKRNRTRLRLLRGGLRQTIEIPARDVLWSQDAMQAGRRDGGEPVMADVLRDAGARRTLSLSIGSEVSGDTVIAQLEATRRVRGRLPLVLSSDNGPAYCNEAVADYLERHQVLHLKTLPRTPQHNAWAERGIGALRRESGIASHTVLAGGVSEAIARLGEAAWRLDTQRRRPGDYPTIEARDNALPHGYDEHLRARLYRAACARLEDALHEHPPGRKRRRAQREAILVTLEDFQVINRTRGDRQPGSPKSEIVAHPTKAYFDSCAA